MHIVYSFATVSLNFKSVIFFKEVIMHLKKYQCLNYVWKQQQQKWVWVKFALGISVDILLTNCGFRFQESTDIDDEEDEDDKVSALKKYHEWGTSVFLAGSILPGWVKLLL